MNPLKRLGLAAVLVVGLTLLASTPARAGEKAKADWGTIELANVGDELDASGEATLTEVRWISSLSYYLDPWWVEYPDVHTDAKYTGVLTVTCRNLKPGARYWTPAGTFKANRTGTGTVKGKVTFWIAIEHSTWTGEEYIWPWVVDVDRLDPDDSSPTVLTGYFYPPWYVTD